MTEQQTKTKPQITGTIQTKNPTGTDYIPIAKIALWKQNNTGNQPTHKGTVQYYNPNTNKYDGKKQQISLWSKP